MRGYGAAGGPCFYYYYSSRCCSSGVVMGGMEMVSMWSIDDDMCPRQDLCSPTTTTTTPPPRTCCETRAIAKPLREPSGKTLADLNLYCALKGSGSSGGGSRNDRSVTCARREGDAWIRRMWSPQLPVLLLLPLPLPSLPLLLLKSVVESRIVQGQSKYYYRAVSQMAEPKALLLLLLLLACSLANHISTLSPETWNAYHATPLYYKEVVVLVVGGRERKPTWGRKIRRRGEGRGERMRNGCLRICGPQARGKGGPPLMAPPSLVE